MKLQGNQHSKDDEELIDSISLPLYPFFVSLKQNGFSVTPKLIADSSRVIANYAHKVGNEKELCDYLSPLFAKTEDEQKQFRELFESQFKITEEPLPEGWIKKTLRHIKTKWPVYLSGLCVILVGFFLVLKWIQPAFPKIKPDIFINNLNESALKDFSGAYKLKTGEKIELQTQTNYKTADKENGIELQVKYNWGDKIPSADSLSYHEYRTEGTYQISAYAATFYNKKYWFADTAYSSVRICNDDNRIEIENTVSADSLAPNQKIRLRAIITGKKPDQIIWKADNEPEKTGNEFETAFNTEGRHTIYCTAVYDSVNSPCTIQTSNSLSVYNPIAPYLSVKESPGALPVSPVHRLKPFWLVLTGGLALLSYLLFVLLNRLKSAPVRKLNKENEAAKKESDLLLSSLSGNKPPFDVPFQNKNYLPVTQPGINELSRQMRKRINDEGLYLNLQMTISKSIRSGGLFQPVNMPKTQQSEYLVLIQKTSKNNQQVKLFEYLLGIFNRQNVNVEKYYYHDDLKSCYSISGTDVISFEKLSEKYSRYILIIFGDAYQLLFPFYPVFNYELGPIIDRWQYKAVLTPVSFPDWDNREMKGLSPAIPVFPVDNEGLLLFVQTIFSEDQNIISSLYRQRNSFYKVEGIDFETVGELEAYCTKAGLTTEDKNGNQFNLLFQWIAALAIYPKIYWELTLAIGKAILDKYGKTEELNYTNLLRIVRIKWMKEGQFPDYTRLDLLKKLNEDIEVLARETVLASLNEIPASEIANHSFAYEEKEVQRVINEANLYAFDPVKYKTYASSKVVLARLWSEKKIPDSPSRVYFKNTTGDWDTLFKKTGEDGVKSTIGIEEYFDPANKIEAAPRKLNYYAARICSFVFVTSLLSFLALTILNFFSRNRIGALTYEVSAQRNIKFTYLNNSTIPAFDYGLLSVDTLTANLVNRQQESILLLVSDTAREVVFKSAGQSVFDSSMVINKDAYSISLEAIPPTPKANIARLFLTNACYNNLSRYRKIISDIDTDMIVTDSIINNVTSASDCINRVSFGKNISQSIQDKIVSGFSKNRVDLKLNSTSPYTIGENDVAIYYEAAPPVIKPSVFIQYNNSQYLQKAKQLQTCLTGGIFNAPGVEYRANFSRSEIRYYDNSFRDSISLLQSCLRKVYPDKTFYPVQVLQRRSNARAEIWIYDSIVATPPALTVQIQISDESLRQSAEEFKKNLESYRYKVENVRLVNNPYNSEISYSNSSVAAEAENIKQYYSRYYPALPVETRLRSTRGQAITGGTITIWIRKLENEPSQKTDTVSKPVPNNETNNPVQQINDPSIKEIVSIATREIGYTDQPRGSNKTKYGQRFGNEKDPWGGMFVSWVYEQAGKELPYIDSKQPGFISFAAALDYFRNRKLTTTSPQPGDIVIFEANDFYLRSSGLIADLIFGEKRYSGGIFAGWVDQKKKTYEVIGAGNSTGNGANTVIKVQRRSNSSTYFIRVE